EGRERLRDGLLVAYVGEDAADDGHAPAVDGDRQTACGHRGEQADRLEGHGLPTGVRAGNHENAEVATELHVDAHDLPLLHQQGVARVDEIEDAVGVQLRPGRLQR